MKIKSFIIIGVVLFGLISCNSNHSFDASGSFEAQEIIISAEANGVIKEFNIEEGDRLEEGQYIGYIDSTQLFLKLKQVRAQINAALERQPDIKVQLSALQKRLEAARVEQGRVEGMLKGGAATPKQMDDVNAEVEVLERQIDALRSSLTIQSRGINSDVAALDIQVLQLRDQLDKCRLASPVSGTVLSKYVMAHEMVAVGKPLYKIADLSELILRVYVSGNQLDKVNIGNSAKVMTDDGNGGYNTTTGTITWISDKAEFTPKTIQTKDERANKVYAVKIKVPNDGRFKVGMYGESVFN